MNITQLGRVLRNSAVLGLVLLIVLWPADAAGLDDSVREWSQGVWRSVLQSDGASLDSFDELFGDVPVPAGDETAQREGRASVSLPKAKRTGEPLGTCWSAANDRRLIRN